MCWCQLDHTDKTSARSQESPGRPPQGPVGWASSVSIPSPVPHLPTLPGQPRAPRGQGPGSSRPSHCCEAVGILVLGPGEKLGRFCSRSWGSRKGQGSWWRAQPLKAGRAEGPLGWRLPARGHASGPPCPLWRLAGKGSPGPGSQPRSWLPLLRLCPAVQVASRAWPVAGAAPGAWLTCSVYLRGGCTRPPLVWGAQAPEDAPPSQHGQLRWLQGVRPSEKARTQGLQRAPGLRGWGCTAGPRGQTALTDRAWRRRGPPAERQPSR